MFGLKIFVILSHFGRSTETFFKIMFWAFLPLIDGIVEWQESGERLGKWYAVQIITVNQRPLPTWDGLLSTRPPSTPTETILILASFILALCEHSKETTVVLHTAEFWMDPIFHKKYFLSGFYDFINRTAGERQGEWHAANGRRVESNPTIFTETKKWNNLCITCVRGRTTDLQNYGGLFLQCDMQPLRCWLWQRCSLEEEIPWFSWARKICLCL